MKAKKLPSGKYMCQVQKAGTRKAFTGKTEAEALRKASNWLADQEYRQEVGITVSEAMRQYIESKRNLLSPSTIAQYERYLDHGLETIKSVPVSLLTSAQVQSAINAEAGKKTERGGKPLSAKYIKNEYQFLTASVRMVRPEFALRITLPKPTKTYRELPTPTEVINLVVGTDIELPALLAMWLSLTASEIRGIKVSSIKDGILTIDETIVQVNGEAVHKSRGKAFDRNRRIRVPDYIMRLIEQTDAWKEGSGYIEPRSGKALSSRFQRVTGGICRFHDLRHLFASVGLALGVPEKYLMEQGGWSTPSTMKSVYQHTFEQERLRHQDALDQYFAPICASANASDRRHTH